ncbi:MAG: phytanoyl-CoA dioxygenase family protein [Gemmatimonadetes bacterium]|nr:phytanoyl-CoA dioxygenase family protein [Gemmatimonadota bacterium]
MEASRRQQFFEEGYLVIREAVPPERLAELRLSAELMVDRSKALSAAARGGGPPGGDWYEKVQPRVEIDDAVEPETAGLVDFLLGPTVRGVSQELMGAPETAITGMQITCSGLIDYGYTDWHRDSSAREQAPLCGLQDDLMANGPGYVQWNIALYDDDVFWLVPGSHRQPTDEEQRRQLLTDPTSRLRDGIPMDLKAGDGVVYPNVVMHWGSFYSSRLRRTLHLGFRSFGSGIFPYAHFTHWDMGLGFTRHLSPQARAYFERTVELFDREGDEIERTLRAVIDGDGGRFREQVAILHPGSEGRMTTVVLLCRIAEKIALAHSPEVAALPEEERNRALSGPSDGHYYGGLAARFSDAEAAALEKRFAVLTGRLEQDAAAVHERYLAVHEELKPEAESPPDFESRPLRQFHCDMPEGFGIDEFVESW